jgi:hypothetical protein
MTQNEKITDGLNDRSRNDTIAQSGAGIPDDSGAPISIDDASVERAKKSLDKLGQRTRRESKDH